MSESVTFAMGDGTVLAGERRPGAGPTVVLLHAGVADRRAWRAVMAEPVLAGLDLVAYDRRGFGETPATGVPDHLGDLRSVITSVADGPARLVGNSQGGRIALDLAASEPGLVAGLVLIAPAVSGAPDPDEDALDADTRRIDADIEAADAAGDLEAVNRHEVRLWLDGPSGPEGRVGGAARELALEMNAITLTAEWGADPPAELPTWDRLGDIQVPATVACGELDLPFFLGPCRVLAERLPGAGPAITLPGVAHLPGLEAPGMVASLIAAAVGR